MNSTVGPNFKVVCPKKKKKSTYGFYKQCIEPIKKLNAQKILDVVPIQTCTICLKYGKSGHYSLDWILHQQKFAQCRSRSMIFISYNL